MNLGPSKSIAVLYNPLSGRGRGAAAAQALGTRLERMSSGGGKRAFVVNVKPLPKPGGNGDFLEISTLLRGAEVCIVLGGDGTVRATLPSLASLGIPMLTLGMGTENLFAKQFHMPRGLGEASLAQIEQILREGSVVEIDLARVRVQQQGDGTQGEGVARSHESYFSLMASMGPDASIVQRLSVTRNGPIRHWSYVRPIMHEVMAGYVPRCTVDVCMRDGKKRRLVDRQQGFVIVANSERYALGMNPVPDADMSDGLLEVCFFPARGIVQAAGWYMRFMLGLGREGGDGGASEGGRECLRGRGEEIHVRLERGGNAEGENPQNGAAGSGATFRGHALQLDGDSIPLGARDEVLEAIFSLCESKVKVIQMKQ